MTRATRRILIKHIGNMGDHLFLVGPLLEVLARRAPNAEITLVTAWGYKDQRGRWGERNQDGFCIALMMKNPHIDHLVHWHDTKRSLEGAICVEEGRTFPTWDPAWYERQKAIYDVVLELDFGLTVFDNPLERVYERAGLDGETHGIYPLYGSPSDWEVGRAVAATFPKPRVVFLEGLDGQTMRGWDPQKVTELTARLREKRIEPIWFGAKYPKMHGGRSLTLRENIAFAGSCDVAIGVMSGPMHFAAAAGVPTICLYGGQPLHRAAPSFFLNPYIPDTSRHHVTIEGPTCDEPCFLKREILCKNLSKAEAASSSGFRTWQEPGRQSDKSCVATIPVETVLAAILENLKRRHLTP